MLNKAGGETTEANSSSVGLAVKQYCNKQIQLHTLVQQTMSDVSYQSLYNKLCQM